MRYSLFSFDSSRIHGLENNIARICALHVVAMVWILMVGIAVEQVSGSAFGKKRDQAICMKEQPVRVVIQNIEGYESRSHLH